MVSEPSLASEGRFFSQGFYWPVNGDMICCTDEDLDLECKGLEEMENVCRSREKIAWL